MLNICKVKVTILIIECRVGDGADPGLKAVSLQVTAYIVINPVVGSHHRLPSPQ